MTDISPGPRCDRIPPWRLVDRVLRTAGWHCATCWRHERDGDSAGPVLSDGAARPSSRNRHENADRSDMRDADAGRDRGSRYPAREA